MTRWGRRTGALAAVTYASAAFVKFAFVAVVFVAVVFVYAGCAPPADEAIDVPRRPSQDSATISEVRAVLDAQAAAWNDGDIRGFMDGYAQSDTLRFASGGRVIHGWNVTLERYRTAYADAEQMGMLSFSDVDVWPLSERYALAFGRWALDRSERIGDAGGLFTLTFENGPDGWKIVHDHTSASPSNERHEQDSIDTNS